MFDLDPSAFDAPQTHRPLHPTMGQGVAERTYLRRIFTDIQRAKLGGYGVLLNKKDPLFIKWFVAALNSDFAVEVADDAPFASAEPDTRWETWNEVAHRVALGNVSLLGKHRPDLFTSVALPEHRVMADAIASGELLMSGRHLQQGDIKQSQRSMEVFSNCAVSPTTFGLLKLLLSGAGVGRDYSDKMMVVDWAAHMPTVVPVLSASHPDYVYHKHTTPREAEHVYGKGEQVVWFRVPDTREGWAKAVEIVETATYLNATADKDHKVLVVVLDFSQVRAEGEPIMGMQGRPSSGPGPLIDAIGKIARIKGSGMAPWRATLYIDHYSAEIVLVGGARRAARMSTKYWKDADIIDFIRVKRPLEFAGLSADEVAAYLADVLASGGEKPLSFLWSSNNSVAVDREFWDAVNNPEDKSASAEWARTVYAEVMACAYADGTGEPGFINVDRLTSVEEGLDHQAYISGEFFGSAKYQIEAATTDLLRGLYQAFLGMPYHYITNPCGEIALLILGGFCVIADIVPAHSDTPERAIEVARIAVRALMRVNLMDSVFNVEVARTNRIGVGVTGIHEAAWRFFRVGFLDLVNPDFGAFLKALACDEDPRSHADGSVRAAAFWSWVGDIGAAVRQEAEDYAEVLGVAVPHTCTTEKPSGSVSKLFGLTEGWHLPSMRHYMRWVQFHKNSPMLDDYRAKGYPVRELTTYRDHWIVGFPTEPAICAMGMGDALVTAGEASVSDQFRWLQLGEFFLLEGGTVTDYALSDGDIDTFLRKRGVQYGNQISYTLKYRPSETSFDAFCGAISAFQPLVRCVSVMPQEDGHGAYEYLPEESVSVTDYHRALLAIQRDDALSEDVGLEHLDCASGACPITFNRGDKSSL